MRDRHLLMPRDDRPVTGGLNSGLHPFIPRREQEFHTMLALAVIFGFVAVLAIINIVEFGRVD